ncbi:sigma-54-dependent transcriptional regulator [Corallococcus sicarius]|uniref:Sigma-54-dependent Fis family transcriptional regulator n=1 Tax=Corallococcus sicarius TaxID=2316726 RepID=A0A3A8NJR8_9BACT|nr:sigma-54 dependent transcriptional regulator [Corallococcus sicarius]RKH43799.1 sigma-54-dependent Fis family transcriptional regulator [Corallococcus sicarius]
MKILIIDDHRSARRILTTVLSSMAGVEFREAASLDEAQRCLREEFIDVALVDIRLSADACNTDGLTLIEEIRKCTSAVPIVVTASSEMEEIRKAMRLGAYDYVLKDGLCKELIVPILEGLRDRRRLEQEVQVLRAREGAQRMPVGMVGTSAALQRLLSLVRRVALSDRPVLVLGPTGTGKELVVRALHAMGARPDAPLLEINCGAIPEQLMESQLFGHERGAFTGAERRQDGLMKAVGQGTLFLDEIAELPLSLQAKLLRVLEAGHFRPIGATAEQPFHGRVAAATHADLEDLVRQRRFREDLYFRLNVLEVRVPSLEDRCEDIPALLAHFVQQQRRPLRFSSEAVDLLTRMAWPGNVRQLRNLVDRVAVFAETDEVTPEVLSGLPGRSGQGTSREDPLKELVRMVLRMPEAGDKLERLEQAMISEAMTLAEGNKSAAARLLGVHRKAIERRLGRKEDEPLSGPED